MTRSTFGEWLNREELSPLELAILMADTCPDWPIGKEMLDACLSVDPTVYQDIVRKYVNVPSQWAYFEKFEWSRELIFKSQRIGELANKAPNGKFPSDVAIDFVLRLDGSEHAGGERFPPFVKAAIELQTVKGSSTPMSEGGRQEGVEWWRVDHDFEDMIRTRVDRYLADKVNLTRRGKPNKLVMAREISQTINAIERRNSTDRSIGPESIRRQLKNRKF